MLRNLLDLLLIRRRPPVVPSQAEVSPLQVEVEAPVVEITEDTREVSLPVRMASFAYATQGMPQETQRAGLALLEKQHVTRATSLEPAVESFLNGLEPIAVYSQFEDVLEDFSSVGHQSVEFEPAAAFTVMERDPGSDLATVLSWGRYLAVPFDGNDMWVLGRYVHKDEGELPWRLGTPLLLVVNKGKLLLVTNWGRMDCGEVVNRCQSTLDILNRYFVGSGWGKLTKSHIHVSVGVKYQPLSVVHLVRGRKIINYRGEGARPQNHKGVSISLESKSQEYLTFEALQTLRFSDYRLFNIMVEVGEFPEAISKLLFSHKAAA